MNKEQLARYIALHAERAGLSQIEIARKANVSKDAVNRVFNAREGAGQGVLQKISDVLGVVIPNTIIPTQLQEKEQESNY